MVPKTNVWGDALLEDALINVYHHVTKNDLLPTRQLETQQQHKQVAEKKERKWPINRRRET